MTRDDEKRRNRKRKEKVPADVYAMCMRLFLSLLAVTFRQAVQYFVTLAVRSNVLDTIRVVYRIAKRVAASQRTMNASMLRYQPPSVKSHMASSFHEYDIPLVRTEMDTYYVITRIMHRLTANVNHR